MTSIDLDRPDDRETIERLSRILPPVSPRPGLLDAIVSEARRGGLVVPLRPRRRRLGVVSGLAAAAAAALVVASFLFLDGSPPVADREAAVSGADIALTGDARLVGSRSDDGHLLLTLNDVPPAPPGHHYSVWVLRRGTSEMEAVGTFTASSRSVRLDLPLPGSGDYVAVDISVEENAGNPAHSGVSLAGATFS